MAFAAANMRLPHVTFCFLTVGTHLHPPLECGAEWTRNRGMQLKKFTGIRARDSRHRAGPAKIGCPLFAGSLKQAAFLQRTSAEVVAVKIFTFDTGWGAHGNLWSGKGKGEWPILLLLA